MLKKVLSAAVAAAMALSVMPMAMAEETRAPGIYVGDTEYDTIAAAQAAAVNQGGTITISGTVEFDYRQGISADNITLQGENNATIVPSGTYGDNTSDTNKKGLLNFAGDNITVNDITFDGSVYGDTITATTTPDFIVVRVNEGSATFNGVSITGSPRTLLVVGTTTTTATLTANNLYCQGEYKSIDLAGTYADVNIVNGSFTLNSGQVNGFIYEDSGLSGLNYYEGTFYNNATSNHFALRHRLGFFSYDYMTSTVEHYVNSYMYAKESVSDEVAKKYINAVNISSNIDTIEDMVAYAVENCNAELKNNFVSLLEDAKEEASASTADKLDVYIDRLKGVVS